VTGRDGRGWPQGPLAFGAVDGCVEAWLNRRVGASEWRRACPLLVEIVCWCASPADLDLAVRLVERFFDEDSVLAAVVRQDGAYRLMVYTACREMVAQARYRDVRGALRPVSMGLSVGRDPDWERLTTRTGGGVSAIIAGRAAGGTG
jgi:hypothetical protein